MAIIPQCNSIPIPGTKAWDEWTTKTKVGLSDSPTYSESIGEKLSRWIDHQEQSKYKTKGAIQITQDQFHKVIKKARKDLEKQLKLLRKKSEEENIKSDFYMTHEIATISGEIKGILMIYEALEEVVEVDR